MTAETRNTKTPRPAVFLDRDGTIIVEKDFLRDPEGVELLPRAAEAIKKLNDANYLVICVSNQSGVARGYYDEDTVVAVNRRVIDVFRGEGAIIDEIYYCPHYPQGDQPEYAISCTCRKPKTGMAERAMQKYAIDLAGSAMIGDREADIQFGKNLKITALLVTTGYGQAEKERIEDEQLTTPEFVARDLSEAVEWILQQRHK